MKKILSIVIVGLSLCAIASCDDINSIHEEYIDKGEILYVGGLEIIATNAGYERIQLVWKLNADPKIKETCIYWNNGNTIQDSLFVPIDRSDSVMRQIIPLTEDKYLFTIKNRSVDGEESLFQNVSSESFGEEYKNRLSARPIISQEAEPDSVQVNWASIEGCVGVLFTYKNNQGAEKILEIPKDESTTVIKDYVPGGEFSYTSLYVPIAYALDTIPSLPTKGNFDSLPEES